MKRFTLLVLLFAGCAETADPPVVWDCACVAACDGYEETARGQVCSDDREEVSQMVSDETASCREALAGSCTSYRCDCACVPTDQTCE